MAWKDFSFHSSPPSLPIYSVAPLFTASCLHKTTPVSWTIRRMLRTGRYRRLLETFSEGWVNFERVTRCSKNTKSFPTLPCLSLRCFGEGERGHFLVLLLLWVDFVSCCIFIYLCHGFYFSAISF